MSAKDNNMLGNMEASTDDPQPAQFTAYGAGGLPKRKPIVVGLYEVPGCGKTYLLNELKQKLGERSFNFQEGSETITSVVPGGLDAFKKLDEHKKKRFRELAIEKIKIQQDRSWKPAIVTGHLMF